MNNERPGIVRPFLWCDEPHRCVSKFGQTPVKKVFALWHDKKLRPGLQTIEPLHSFVDIDEFILIALHNEPRTVRL